jgi:hypothetical protein
MKMIGSKSLLDACRYLAWVKNISLNFNNAHVLTIYRKLGISKPYLIIIALLFRIETICHILNRMDFGKLPFVIAKLAYICLQSHLSKEKDLEINHHPIPNGYT